MAKWTSETSKPLPLTTCEASSSAISSPGLAAGAMPSDVPDGTMLDLFGQVRVPASRSRAQDNAEASTMSATCGRPGVGSLRSNVLQRCLESNLRRRMNGFDWCIVTWTTWDTPWGALRYKPRYSALTTSEIAIGLWPTLTSTANLFAPSMQKWPRHRSLLPTLTAHDYRGGAKPERTAKMRETSKRGTDLVTTLREHYGGTGRINPSWAAAFMGYPIEWAQCAASAMPSSRKSRRK